MFRFHLLLLLLLFLPTYVPGAHAQEAPDILPPLDVVIEAALAYSPRLHYQQAYIEQTDYKMRDTQLRLFERISLGAASRYDAFGNQLYLGVAEAGAEATATERVLNEYGRGVTLTGSVRISLFDIIGRRSRVQIRRQEQAMARFKHDEVALEEMREVTKLYHTVLVKYRLVSIMNAGHQAAQAHLAMAEKAFQHGEIPIAQLADVTEYATTSRAEYEIAYTNYQIAYHELEQTVGTSLDSLRGGTP